MMLSVLSQKRWSASVRVPGTMQGDRCCVIQNFSSASSSTFMLYAINVDRDLPTVQLD